MEKKFEPLKENEIVSLGIDVEKSRILLRQPTYKVSELLRALRMLVNTSDETLESYRTAGILYKLTEEKLGWFSHGVDCEALKLDTKGWQKGKIRLALEFCPDEPEIAEAPANDEIILPESPLDELRQKINQKT